MMFDCAKHYSYFETMKNVGRVQLPPDVVQVLDAIHRHILPDHPPVNWFCGACVEGAMCNVFNTYIAQKG